MAYNPYNAIKHIYDSKVAYHTNQSLGKDPEQFHAQALPSYQELVKNGYEGLASQLEGMDAVQAGELLKNYKPDEQFNVDDAFNTMTGGSASTATGQTNGGNRSVYSGIDPTANNSVIDNFVNQIQNGTDMMNGTYQTAQGIATGAVQTQPSAVTQGLFDAYNDSNNRLNGAIQYDANGNVISGLNTEHYNIGRNQLNYLNNFDVTKQPYYQGIMDAYNLGGYNAAQGAYANGAADNGGNIDSYAAANANRQQLAFTTAGMQQAMAMANQNQQNWQNLYSQMSQDLNNQGVLSLQTLDIAKQMYAADAQERMNALDNAGALASQQMAAAVQAFQSLVQERMNDKGITAEMAMQDKDIAAAREQLEMQLASNERIQEGINALGYYQTDANERMNTENNQTQRYGYDTERDIAGINSQTQLGVAGINRDATLGAAGINANASMTNAALQADLNRYLGELGYKQALAGYQNALDQISAQSTANMSQAQYADKIQREYNQWLLDNGYLPSGVTLQNPNTGTTPIDDDTQPVHADPEMLGGTFALALLDNDVDKIKQGKFDSIKTGDDLTRLLMAPAPNGYGFSPSEVATFFKAMSNVGYGDMKDVLAKLEPMFPGITEKARNATVKNPVLNS